MKTLGSSVTHGRPLGVVRKIAAPVVSPPAMAESVREPALSRAHVDGLALGRSDLRTGPRIVAFVQSMARRERPFISTTRVPACPLPVG
jgi:hypothetical protein